MEDMEARTRRAVVRFWAAIDKNGAGGCWLWTGRKDPDGYGLVNLSGCHSAHRLAWLLIRGSLPSAGVFLCHSCDVPACCNPDHLFLGTAKDNAEDCVRKGRSRVGERNPQARMTAGVVIDIYRAYQSGQRIKDVAEQFGVTRFAVMRVVHRKNWRAITALRTTAIGRPI
jgi:hypothetical protein